MGRSYAPYSKFHVGAALLIQGGEIITGVNIENSSYGLTLCAERSALSNAVSSEKRNFEKIAIICKGDTIDVEEPSMPCGACRQWISEFSQLSGNDIEIISSNTKKTKIKKAKISELLPEPFGPNNLDVTVSED